MNILHKVSNSLYKIATSTKELYQRALYKEINYILEECKKINSVQNKVSAILEKTKNLPEDTTTKELLNIDYELEELTVDILVIAEKLNKTISKLSNNNYKYWKGQKDLRHNQ